MTRLLSFLGLIVAGAIWAAEPPKKETWSEVANGVRGRLMIDYGPDFVDCEMAVVYLELQNVSDSAGHKDIWFDPGRSLFKWQLQDEKGWPEPQGAAAASIMMELPFWITLPWDSTLRFRVSVSGYGIKPKGGVALQLPSAFWQVQRKKEGAYYLSAVFSNAPNPSDTRRAWTGTLVLPPVLLREK